MSIDKSKATEANHGIIVYHKVGGDIKEGPLICGGPDSPVGLGLPFESFYIQASPGEKTLIWKKFGAGDTVNDWRISDCNDVPFDPTGYLNFQPEDTDVCKALARLGNQSVADIAEIEGFDSISYEDTTSNGWVSKAGFPWVSGPKTAGHFSLRWSVEVGQTKATRNFGFRIRWRPTGGTWTDLSSIASATVSKDNNTIQQAGFKGVDLLVDNSIELDVQYGQTIDGFSAIMENVTVEVRRLGEL